MASITALNDLKDPDRLQVGQVLADRWMGGVVEALARMQLLRAIHGRLDGGPRVARSLRSSVHEAAGCTKALISPCLTAHRCEP